jgi:hypothetical protein
MAAIPGLDTGVGMAMTTTALAIVSRRAGMAGSY